MLVSTIPRPPIHDRNRAPQKTKPIAARRKIKHVLELPSDALLCNGVARYLLRLPNDSQNAPTHIRKNLECKFTNLTSPDCFQLACLRSLHTSPAYALQRQLRRPRAVQLLLRAIVTCTRHPHCALPPTPGMTLARNELPYSTTAVNCFQERSKDKVSKD